MVKALKPIYQAEIADQAAQRLEDFEAGKWGSKYPATLPTLGGKQGPNFLLKMFDGSRFVTRDVCGGVRVFRGREIRQPQHDGDHADCDHNPSATAHGPCR